MLHTEEPMVNVIATLRARGYTENFNLLEENLSYKQDGEPVDLGDIVIDKIYRFSGMNDVGDEAILYAMTDTKDGVKGIFVNAYGIYSDEGANRVIRQIAVQEDDNDDWLKG